MDIYRQIKENHEQLYRWIYSNSSESYNTTIYMFLYHIRMFDNEIIIESPNIFLNCLI